MSKFKTTTFWIPCVLFGAFLGLLYLDTRLPMSTLGHQAYLIGLITAFGLAINAWAKLDRLEQMRRRHSPAQVESHPVVQFRRFLQALPARLRFATFLIPFGVMVASAVLPLQPVIRQGMIGVILVWFGFEAMTGFSHWH